MSLSELLFGDFEGTARELVGVFDDGVDRSREAPKALDEPALAGRPDGGRRLRGA